MLVSAARSVCSAPPRLRPRGRWAALRP